MYQLYDKELCDQKKNPKIYFAENILLPFKSHLNNTYFVY